MTVVIKLIKRIVFKQLYEYLNNNNLFPSRLFSTETALLEVSNEWLWNIDNNFLKGVIFISLKYAFDVIDYIIMLENSHFMGSALTLLIGFSHI